MDGYFVRSLVAPSRASPRNKPWVPDHDRMAALMCTSLCGITVRGVA